MKKHVLVVGLSVPQCLKNDPSITIIHRPLIKLRPFSLDRSTLERCSMISQVIITSKHAVGFLRLMYERAGILPQHSSFFCVGSVTADRIRTLFPKAEILIAATATQEGVSEVLLAYRPKNLLWPHSSDARKYITNALAQADIQMTELVLYRPIPSLQSCPLNRVNTVYFTSPSSVDVFFNNFHKQVTANISFQTIGPITQARLLQRLTLLAK